ncbi:hypothetical protein ONS95_007491 [Cadophora gregata]|uniref:uncharacterized protein n=1 Tax=Cadophora gregata TaxID=51156 RepID=UPI0026DC9FA7|nr:uncharacterized protein ONS95_007491 [Cadophora gregata]KAK0118606.1 hypothetical protein ONS96_011697 [Cadophora gregata f. sp. sojae]KAK0125860.1 hypothetical protein ONS95_007491 [Cadophora gregata]
MEIHPKVTLSSLPPEILQQIATYLPPITVISILLVSHSLRKVIDSRVVWKVFIVNNARFPNGIPDSVGEERGDGDKETKLKSFVLADILAERWEDSRRRFEETDLRWLPMLTVVGHPVLKSLTPYLLEHLAVQLSGSLQTDTPLFDIPPRKDGRDQQNPLIFPVNPNTSFSLEQWQSQLTGSFCFAMTRMSTLSLQKATEEDLRLHQQQTDSPQDDDPEPYPEISTIPPPIPQLSKIPWFNFNPREPSLSLSPEKRGILITALHALSLTAIAHFSTELDLAISEYRVASTTIDQVSHPPTSKTIAKHLWTLASSDSSPSSYPSGFPPPFSPLCIDKFGKSHLSYMATEQFFEDGEWTGAFAYTGLWAVKGVGGLGRDVFDCVGGVNRMVKLGGWDVPNHGERGEGKRRDGNGLVVEGVVRFRRVVGVTEDGADMDGQNEMEGGNVGGKKEKSDVFMLRSNAFYSQIGTYILELRVQRSTGLIAVKQRDALAHVRGVGGGCRNGRGDGSCWGAALTPFGVVGAVGVGGSWMWLWKRDWSGGVEREV